MKTSPLLLTLVLLAGCVTSSKMPPKKVEQLKPNEGRVIGSVLLTVPTEKDPSSWAWLQGRKAESFTYELSIQAPSLLPNPFAKTYVVVAKIGKEEHFVMKLPAGEYEFKEMKQRGFSNLASYIGRRFTVPAGVTSYAGRLVVAFPERLVGGTAFAWQVDDAQNQTIASLKETYGDVFTNVVKTFVK